MNLLSIGSVIRNKGVDLIITGYHLSEADGKFKLYYIVSLFPVGYIPGQKKSQAYYPVDKEYELIAEGYKDEHSEKYLAKLSERYADLRDIDTEVLSAFLAETLKRMEVKGNE